MNAVERLGHIVDEAKRRRLRLKTLKVSRAEWTALCRLAHLFPDRTAVVTFCDIPLQVVRD